MPKGIYTNEKIIEIHDKFTNFITNCTDEAQENAYKKLFTGFQVAILGVISTGKTSLIKALGEAPNSKLETLAPSIPFPDSTSTAYTGMYMLSTKFKIEQMDYPLTITFLDTPGQEEAREAPQNYLKKMTKGASMFLLLGCNEETLKGAGEILTGIGKGDEDCIPVINIISKADEGCISEEDVSEITGYNGPTCFTSAINKTGLTELVNTMIKLKMIHRENAIVYLNSIEQNIKDPDKRLEEILKKFI